MIHVIAAIKAKEGLRDALAAAFRETLPAVRAKAGCIEYSLAVHVPTGLPGQLPFEGNELIIVEKWANPDALRAHISAPSYRAWYMNIWPMVAGACMQVFEALD
jgi:quinol monooxygenase YgiN